MTPITPPKSDDNDILPEKPKPKDTPFPAPGQPPTPEQQADLEDDDAEDTKEDRH
jgi:hypothetical protein